MSEADVQRFFRERLGLRIGPEMAKYVLSHGTGSAGSTLPVMGADARTGVPVRLLADVSALAASPPANEAVRLA